MNNLLARAAAVALGCLVLLDGVAYAHGGRLAADGCHNDGRTGTRHCHRKDNNDSAPESGAVSASDCSAIRYERREWSYRGVRFSTNTGYYSGLQCSKIDADHLVSLKDAHDSGACRWSQEAKARFANDRDNLVPSCAHINRSKGARLPAGFIRGASDRRGVDFVFPPQDRCKYLSRYKQVKEKYGLSFDNNSAAVFAACGL